jgi:hypothetical protein
MRLLFPVALLAACTGPTDTCGVTVESVSLADGATGVYARGPITVELSDVDATASVRVLNAEGNAANGDLSVDASTLVFTPFGLDPNAEHTLEITTCAGTETRAFTTSDLGTSTTEDLVGATYEIDFSTTRTSEPEGIPDLLGLVYIDYMLAATITEVRDDEVELILGYITRDPLGQDVCSPTIDMPVFDWNNPHFEVDSDGYALRFAVGPVATNTLKVSGSLRADGGAIEELAVHVNLDSRPLIAAFTDDPEAPEDTMCEFTAAAGVECVACEDGSGEFCLDLKMSGITAARVEAELVLWTEADVAGETCEE